MFRRIAVAVALCLALAAVVTIHTQAQANERLKRDNASLALKETNTAAQLAVTYKVADRNGKIAAMLGDSLVMYARLVVQTAQQSDSVDRALKLERRGKYAMAVQLDSLQRRQVAAVVSSDSADHVRRASFDVRQAPYTVTAAVALPPAPDTARLDLRIALDPIPVVARLSCAPPNDHGIRAASIEATTPKWASVRFDDVSQSPDLCASPALTHVVGRSLLKFKPMMIGGGRIVLPDGTSRWGGFVGAGFAIGST